jgi:hypothetical protein
LKQQLLHFKPYCHHICRKGLEESNLWHCLVKNPMDHSSSPCADRNPRSVGCLNMAKTDRTVHSMFWCYIMVLATSVQQRIRSISSFLPSLKNYLSLVASFTGSARYDTLLLSLDLPETGRPYDAIQFPCVHLYQRNSSAVIRAGSQPSGPQLRSLGNYLVLSSEPIRLCGD